MEITIQYTGQLVGAAGRSEERVSVEEKSRLKPLLEGLARSRGGEYADLLFDNEGNLRASLLVIVDGAQVGDDRESLEIGDVRTVMLMTPIAGG